MSAYITDPIEPSDAAASEPEASDAPEGHAQGGEAPLDAQPVEDLLEEEARPKPESPFNRPGRSNGLSTLGSSS